MKLYKWLQWWWFFLAAICFLIGMYYTVLYVPVVLGCLGFLALGFAARKWWKMEKLLEKDDGMG